jgi:hypothetical protein
MTRPGPQLLGVLGLLGSLFWLSLSTFLSPDWGPPGSTNYLGYETLSRLWAPAFALMLCGYLGLYQRHALHASRLGRVGFRLAVSGLALMIAGNVAEFWLFTELPYGALNARSFAWIGVLLGMLALLSGAALLGLAALRSQSLPRWSGLLFVLALPATLLLILAAVELMSLPIVIISAVAGALAAWPAMSRLTPRRIE